MKDYRKIVYVLIAVSLVNLAAMLCVIPGVPENIPTHFNYRFEVDAMGSRWFLAIVPSITAVFSLSMAVEQWIRGKNYANNKPLSIFAVVFVALFITLGWTLYAMSGTGAQLGDTTSVPLDLIIGLGMSVLFIVMGNYLPTVKQNRTFGIKLKVTFDSEEVWRRTHRFGGRVMVIGGFFSAICALVGYFTGLQWLIFAGLMLGVFGSCLIILIYAKRVSREVNG